MHTACSAAGLWAGQSPGPQTGAFRITRASSARPRRPRGPGAPATGEPAWAAPACCNNGSAPPTCPAQSSGPITPFPWRLRISQLRGGHICRGPRAGKSTRTHGPWGYEVVRLYPSATDPVSRQLPPTRRQYDTPCHTKQLHRHSFANLKPCSSPRAANLRDDASGTPCQFPTRACGSSQAKHTLRVNMRPLHPHEPPNTGTAPPPRHAMKGAGGR